jgi:hypothetical protein
VSVRPISLHSVRFPLAALAVVLALVVAGCGDDKKGGPIPGPQAIRLNALLTQTQQRMDAGNACEDVHNEDLPQLEATVNRLPGSVDHDTRTTLKDGVRHLRTLVNQECGQIRAEKQKTQTETTPTETTPTETTPTETTPTETTPTETTPTQTQPQTNTSGGQTVPENNGGGAGPGNNQGQD